MARSLIRAMLLGAIFIPAASLVFAQGTTPPAAGSGGSGASCKYTFPSKAGGAPRQGYLDNGQELNGMYGKWRCVNGTMKKIG